MEIKKGIIIFSAYGHENISASHKSTFEITKDNYLTKRGNCIIGIKSNISVNMLPTCFRDYIKDKNINIEIKLEAGGFYDIINAKGHDDLKLSSNNSIVIRKSSYIDDRTLAINADKAAIDIDRKLINYLKKRGKLRVIITLK